MLTLQQINSAVISGQFSNEDLNSILMAVRFATTQLAQKNRFTLVKGSKVKFTSTRTGKTVVGEVSKVNRKFVIVASGLTTWRVPANMLEAA